MPRFLGASCRSRRVHAVRCCSKPFGADRDRAGECRVERFELEVSAAHRSRGLPNVALGTSLLFAREGWKVVDSPADARALPRSAGGFSIFEPDRHGRWLLEDIAAPDSFRSTPRVSTTRRSIAVEATVTPRSRRRRSNSPMASILQREIEAR